MEIDEVDYYDNLFRDLDHYDVIINRTPQLIPRLPKRYIRDISNPLDRPESEFIKRYRFRQDVVINYILPKINPHLMKSDRRGLPIEPCIQLLITLRYYATASFQIVCGDLISIHQSTISNIVARVSKLLASLCRQYIKYPSVEESEHNRTLFQIMGQHGAWPGLPDVDGAIDCTHIKIVNTPGAQHHEVYRNRKSWFSLNVQAVVGPQREFLDIVARWAGSTHDSRIFQLSTLNMKYREGAYTGILIGDNGYPSLPYLLVPVNPARTEPQQRFNKAHIQTRNVVERTFGIWKRKFPCLSRGMGNKLSTVTDIIVACAVLHNMALITRDPMPDDDIDESIEQQPPAAPLGSGTTNGFLLRENIISSRYT